MLAPESMPVLGPVGLPPPQEYGVPIWEPPRRMTYSMDCGPRTRPGATLAAPGGGPKPSVDRNLRPRSIVASVACAVAASDALAMDSGSPGAPALSSFGRVGSHWP